jgi:DNA gyrase subunit A
LLFSNFGKVYSTKCFSIPEAARTARGRAIVNIVQIAQDEKINAIIPMKSDEEGYIAFATKNGQIKKTDIQEFAHINKNGKIAIKLNEGDELISVQFTTGSDEIMIASREGKCIRFSETEIRAMGRDTAGVKAMNLNKEDRLVDMLVVHPEKYVLTVTSNGYGKRSRLDDYRLQGRAGKGVKAGTLNEATGYIVNLKQVTDDEDVMIISDGGTIIRMHCSDISIVGRAARGVRLMRLKDGVVATVALTERDDDVETVAPEETIAEGEVSEATQGDEAELNNEAEETVEDATVTEEQEEENYNDVEEKSSDLDFDDDPLDDKDDDTDI